jgi:hypothetical protein
LHRPSVRCQTDWLSEGLRQLEAIEQLPDGWDSRGGERPNTKIVNAARSLLIALSAADDDVTKPHIYPTPSGGVQFHWESTSRYFEIDVVDDLTAQFYFLDRDNRTESEGQITLAGPLDELLEMLRQIETR